MLRKEGSSITAFAQNLYINVQRLRVEDKKLSSGCELTVRTKFDGDKMRCTDQDGMSIYHWHAVISPGSAQCRMHWVNDNTLDVEPGVR